MLQKLIFESYNKINLIIYIYIYTHDKKQLNHIIKRIFWLFSSLHERNKNVDTNCCNQLTYYAI